jgi:ribosomal protein S18 acetylase RimI-like enzyme
MSPQIADRIEAVLGHVGRDLAYFTLLADLTTLVDRCRFGLGGGESLAVRYLDLSFAAVAFYGQGRDLAKALRAVLDPGERCYVLVGEQQRDDLASVCEVLHVDPEWQMEYRGDVQAFDPGEAVSLDKTALPAMRQLAALGGLHAFEGNPLVKGPYNGVWRGSELASMAGTHLCVSGVAEIGNVVTAPAYRRQGLARMAVAATAGAIFDAGLEPMLQVFKTNEAAIALYEGLGFERVRTMYLVQFRLLP